ncbi:hypothetical protein L204_101607 [Cryptococcus depauperatus]
MVHATGNGEIWSTTWLSHCLSPSYPETFFRLSWVVRQLLSTKGYSHHGANFDIFLGFLFYGPASYLLLLNTHRLFLTSLLLSSSELSLAHNLLTMSQHIRHDPFSLPATLYNTAELI